MSSSQQLVGAAGLGLIVANAFTTQRADLAGLWSGSGDLTTAHAAAKAIGLEALGVGALVLVAGTSDTASAACLAVIACLWLVFLMARHPTSGVTYQHPDGTWQQLGPYASNGSGLQPGPRK